MNTTTKLKTGLLISALGLASIPMTALALTAGDTLGTSEADIRAALVAEGYEVLEFETEDDEIEVEVSRDGQVFEIELSADTGTVLEVELED